MRRLRLALCGQGRYFASAVSGEGERDIVNPADPRWLEILKASGWQTTSLTIASAVIWILIANEVIPTTDSPLWIAIPAIGVVVFGFLSLGAIGGAAVEYFQPGKAFNLWLAKRRKTQEVRDFIPFMTKKDKEIIGYLLYHNQKVFQTNQDAGYAAPLLSKGIIRIAANRGQVIDTTRVPFEVPDYIWQVLESHRESFAYAPPKPGEKQIHPWAIHWMAR
jgi:hypothetical protein